MWAGVGQPLPVPLSQEPACLCVTAATVCSAGATHLPCNAATQGMHQAQSSQEQAELAAFQLRPSLAQACNPTGRRCSPGTLPHQAGSRQAVRAGLLPGHGLPGGHAAVLAAACLTDCQADRAQVGYCQGMNYLAAMLLCVVQHRQEDAFWLLATLIDDGGAPGVAPPLSGMRLPACPSTCCVHLLASQRLVSPTLWWARMGCSCRVHGAGHLRGVCVFCADRMLPMGRVCLLSGDVHVAACLASRGAQRSTAI